MNFKTTERSSVNNNSKVVERLKKGTCNKDLQIIRQQSNVTATTKVEEIF